MVAFDRRCGHSAFHVKIHEARSQLAWRAIGSEDTAAIRCRQSPPKVSLFRVPLADNKGPNSYRDPLLDRLGPGVVHAAIADGWLYRPWLRIRLLHRFRPSPPLWRCVRRGHYGDATLNLAAQFAARRRLWPGRLSRGLGSPLR
jgi:hypothetical protein